MYTYYSREGLIRGNTVNQMSQNSRLFIAGSLGMIKKFFYTIFKFNCPIRLQFLCQCFENIFLIIHLIRLTKIHFEKKHYQTCWFEYFSICLVWICKLMYDNRGHSRTTLTQFCHFWPPPPPLRGWFFYPGCEKIGMFWPTPILST